MRILSWIVMIPLGLVIIFFSAANLQKVSLSLWPLPFELTLPMFTVVLAIFVVGFLMGGIAMWGASAKHRRRAREERWRADAAERKLHTANAKLEKAGSDSPKPGSTLPATTGSV